MTPPERRVLERPPGSDVWSRERRDAWRMHFFEEQIAWEAQQRRHHQALRRAILMGSAVGLVSALIVALLA